MANGSLMKVESTLYSTQAPLYAFEMEDFWKYYEKWNIFSWGANVPFSIFSKLLKCKKIFYGKYWNFELFIDVMQCSKYRVWKYELFIENDAMF